MERRYELLFEGGLCGSLVGSEQRPAEGSRPLSGLPRRHFASPGNEERRHQSLSDRTPAGVYRAGIQGG